MESNRILGIDTGTNSLGWAIIDRNGDICTLIDWGVHLFQEGVKIDKGIESSKASERTMHHALRNIYYRRKIRKIRVLTVLSQYGLCPVLSPELLSGWRLKRVYHAIAEFMQWQATDDKAGVNPYAMRCECLHRKLDLSLQSDRYILGRALYHIAQRRGFKSNRKADGADDKELGKVKTGIGELSKSMESEGCQYLAEYFLKLYNRGERIRTRYTSRDDHYLAEFRAICTKQELDPALTAALEKAIFDQRPLKSQKFAVGRCPFEPSKTRCQISHPDFEEFRMLQFINGIRMRTPQDDELRPLSAEERASICQLFFRKTKKNFTFEDIAKSLSKPYGKGKIYGDIKTSPHQAVTFNYPMDTPVSGSPVTASLVSIFGNDWRNGISQVYLGGGGKSERQIVDDVWHALSFFEDADKLRTFAIEKLQLNEDDATAFSKISLPDAYASLSRKAIDNILPLLRRGMIYSYAVLLANLGKVMPSYEWQNDAMREAAIDRLIEHLDQYDPKTTPGTMDSWLKDYLKERYHISDSVLKQLYHPSQLEVYPRRQPDDDGTLRLGSPIISAIRNPMAMRSLHQIRHLINTLLESGQIDENTEIHIEFARELNDFNMRQAIYRDNARNRKENERIAAEIAKFRDIEIHDVPQRDILKYKLWEEQGHICLYTGDQIGLADFLGDNPLYDIEHTVPRSAGGDSTLENLTLCQSRFNRETKKTHLPSQLPGYATILERVRFMKDRAEDLTRQIRKLRTDPSMDKGMKDGVIQKRHLLELERNYWRGKYRRFEMESVPEGFSRRQGAGIGLISRYARLFLQSVFRRVDVIKGAATADFRKAWGLQDEYTKKERVNHTHHLIDAIVIACISAGDYNRLAASYHRSGYADSVKADIPAPWKTFQADIKSILDRTLVSSDTPDNMHKASIRHFKTAAGAIKRAKCDAARSSLHNDTIYGAIEQDGAVKYVVRRSLDSFSSEKDLNSIVDPAVRERILEAVHRLGFKEAMASTIWMNEEKHIPIKKVRCYAASVTRPLHIRPLRDASAKEYRRHHHVANDRNYAIAIYAGKDARGKEKRSFIIINNLDAATYFARRNHGEVQAPLIPETDSKGLPLYCVLKTGTKVLLYENSPQEIWDATPQELQRRLYKVSGISSMTVRKNSYGRIILQHSQEARPSGEIKAIAGAYKCGEDKRAAIFMIHTQFNALIDGVDFKLDILGKIIRLK